MKKNSFKDAAIVGFALFAMFLGAGNLIFPPTLGAISGDKWYMAMLGFMMTGIGLPVLGVIAAAKAGGTIENVAGKVGKKFSVIYGSIITLTIGPLLAIPRVCATTYELSVEPLFPSVSPVLVSVIFFAITLFFVLNPSKVIDKVGAILTPILLFILAAIIVSAVVHPIGVPAVKEKSLYFLNGFKEGYQTMDALGSVIMAAIVIESIVARGYVESKENLSMTIKAGLVSAVCLACVYGGLVYIGGTGSGLLQINPTEPDRVKNLIFLVDQVMGKFGKISLSITVGLACLTTSIGLTATVGDFFSRLTDNKLSYKLIVITTVLFSGVFAVRGVDSIINFSVPILSVLYPVAIVVIIMNLFDDFIKLKWSYKGAVIGAFIAALIETVAKFNKFIEEGLFKKMPFAVEGFAWVIPALIGGISFAIFEYFLNKREKK